MEIKEYFNLFRKWFWLMLLGGILGGGAAFLFSSNQTPIYQAEAQVLVSQPTYGELTDLGYLTGYQLIQTYTKLLLTDQILEETGERLDYHINANAIKVSQIDDTMIIAVIVEDPRPFLASDFANKLIEIFSEQQFNIQTSRYAETKGGLENNLAAQGAIVQENTAALEAIPNTVENKDKRSALEFALSQSRQTYSAYLQNYENLRIAEAQSFPLLTIVDQAEPNLVPIRPKIVNNTLLGLIVGIMFAGGIAFLVEYLDDSIKTIGDIVQINNVEIATIGQIPKVKNFESEKEDGVFIKNYPRSPTAESFRALRTNLDFSNASSPIKTILISSPHPNVGKSNIVANLAMSFRQAGKRVGVIDCDLRRPKIHRLFDVTSELGLSDYFRGPIKHSDIIQVVEKNLFVVTSGKLPPNPAELLSSKKMTEFIEYFSSELDIVLLDSPPTVLTDAIILSAKVDGVILVVEAGKTKINATQNALEKLHRANARILGIVFNKISPKSSKDYYYYRDYN